jgi:hypothetical protein
MNRNWFVRDFRFRIEPIACRFIEVGYGLLDVFFSPDSGGIADISRPLLGADFVEKGGSCDADISVIQSV